MCLPYSMENQPKSKLCHLCFDVDEWCAHNFSLLPKHCCPFPTAIQHHQMAALPDPPFTSPSYAFRGILFTSGGSKCACVSKGRWSKTQLLSSGTRISVPKSKPLCCDLMLWYVSLWSSLSFFLPLFINICRIEFSEQNHSFSLFWFSTRGNGGSRGGGGRQWGCFSQLQQDPHFSSIWNTIMK